MTFDEVNSYFLQDYCDVITAFHAYMGKLAESGRVIVIDTSSVKFFYYQYCLTPNREVSEQLRQLSIA